MEWLKAEVKDEDQINALQDIAEDGALDGDLKLSAALLALNRDLPLLWWGQILSSEWLPENLDIAASILERSSLPAWLKRLRGEKWLEEVAARRKRIWQELERMGVKGRELAVFSFGSAEVALDKNLAERLMLIPADLVVGEALNLKKTYHSSKTAALTSLLKTETLDEAKAILLLACDRRSLITHRAYQDARENAEQELARAQDAVALMKKWRAHERANKEWEEALAHLEEARKEASTATYAACNSAASLASEAVSFAERATEKQKAGFKSEIEKIITEAKDLKS